MNACGSVANSLSRREIRHLVAESLCRPDDKGGRGSHLPDQAEQGTIGRYDFDIAEFPLFRFEKPKLRSHDRDQPLVYTDSIVGKNGERVPRTWKAFPGRYGFGGPSTHVLFYDLLQLYVEDRDVWCESARISAHLPQETDVRIDIFHKTEKRVCGASSVTETYRVVRVRLARGSELFF